MILAGHNSSTNPTNSPGWAREYLVHGWQPVPVPRGEKAPRLRGWQKLRLQENDLAQHFSRETNVGLLLGEPSSGLVDVDLDSPEALAIADDFLPATQLVHGRPAKPRSHRWYIANPSPRPEKLTDLDGGCLVELRSSGQQTLAPPSIHPSGEKLKWESFGRPVQLGAAELISAVRRLAAAALLARHWPAKGQRHETSLALAGLLLRGGWSEAKVLAFVSAVARAAHDEEFRGREADVRSTVKRLAANGQATGRNRLAELLGEKIVALVWQWLEIRSRIEAAIERVPLRQWPAPLEPEAFCGLAGEIVRAIGPHSEADPAALLVQMLVAFGNAVQRSAHFRIGTDRHTTNLFAVLIGRTSKSRKGTSWSQVRGLFSEAVSDWTQTRIQSGLSSGEGLIWAVRDPIEKRVPVKNNGRITAYEPIEEDPGVSDKRLLVVEQEFASTLRVIGREGNTLSAVVRQAWDSGDLRVLTKNSQARASGALISIVGHITGDELLRYLDRTEIGNGFANRFLFLCVQRSKVLPEGGHLEDARLKRLTDHLRETILFAQKVEQMRRDPEAREIWAQIYPKLSEGEPGLLGSIISRAEAQVLRLSMIYALLDSSALIRAEHLRAALAVWEYCEASARYVFGDSLGDPVADEILRALRANPKGLSRTDLRDLFGRNKPAGEVERALGLLLEHGVARRAFDDTGGRRSERWFAGAGEGTTKTTETTKVGG